MDNNSVGFKNLCISWDMGLFLEDPHHDWIGARHDLADLWKDHGMLMGIQPTNVDIMGICWLVVWNIFFPYIGNFFIPTDELIFFRGVETTNQL